MLRNSWIVAVLKRGVGLFGVEMGLLLPEVTLVLERTYENVMLAPSVEMARMVWKRPVKKVTTEEPECTDMGSMWSKEWPCSEMMPVVLLWGWPFGKRRWSLVSLEVCCRGVAMLDRPTCARYSRDGFSTPSVLVMFGWRRCWAMAEVEDGCEGVGARTAVEVKSRLFVSCIERATG